MSQDPNPNPHWTDIRHSVHIQKMHSTCQEDRSRGHRMVMRILYLKATARGRKHLSAKATRKQTEATGNKNLRTVR